jgi:heme/copper-type cytochrome/quinol oxidase subunit 2
MKKISLHITKLLLVLTMVFGGFLASGSTMFLGGEKVLAAACQSSVTNSVLNPDTVNCGDTSTITGKMFLFAQIVAGIVLGVAVIMIAYAGFKYVTSQGDPKATEQAKMQVVAAGIGIGIAMLSFIILNLFKGLFN